MPQTKGKSHDLARDFVKRVLAMVLRIKRDDPRSCDTIQVLSFDEMYATARSMLAVREEFRKLGKPIQIVLRYHYTRREYVASIRKHGLLNHEERSFHHVDGVEFNGAIHGPGIYTAWSPCGYHGAYGDVGLLVVCLVGGHEDLDSKMCRKKDSATVHRARTDEMLILSSSKQCVPVLQFEASQIDRRRRSRADGNVMLGRYHAELQQIINDMFSQLPVAPSANDETPYMTQLGPVRCSQRLPS
jgi:hypothetical protein